LKIKKLFYFVGLFLTLIGIDRWTKHWVLSWPQDHSISLLPYIDFVFVKNRGIAFGLFSDSNVNFLFVSLFSLVLLFLIFHYYMPVFPSYPFVLISSGAIGNILDRILYGYVVDFVKIGSFYVFNVADASITIGSLLLAFMLLTEKKDKHAT
jgi:signal peptidase II